MQDRLRTVLPDVLDELKNAGPDYDYPNELSLNAFIGSKTDDYIDLQHKVIKTPIEFVSEWLKGLRTSLKLPFCEPRHRVMIKLLKGKYPHFKSYWNIFLQRSFLKHYDELYKNRPKVDESEYWFGETSDAFGLLVTPRYAKGKWENDKSEIRHFKWPYWTISHVLGAGLCYMGENKRRTFSNIDDYLQFFRDMVRRTSSKYQLQIADEYISYVHDRANPESTPLLVPELQYDPDKVKHEHRLDFLIINPYDMSKFGCEISPWSTHGKLSGRDKKLSELNEDAKKHFEREMEKHKKYWRKYGINFVTYTDKDLVDISSIWKEIRNHLDIMPPNDQLELSLITEILSQ